MFIVFIEKQIIFKPFISKYLIFLWSYPGRIRLQGRLLADNFYLKKINKAVENTYEAELATFLDDLVSIRPKSFEISCPDHGDA